MFVITSAFSKEQQWITFNCWFLIFLTQWPLEYFKAILKPRYSPWSLMPDYNCQTAFIFLSSVHESLESRNATGLMSQPPSLNNIVTWEGNPRLQNGETEGTCPGRLNAPSAHIRLPLHHTLSSLWDRTACWQTQEIYFIQFLGEFLQPSGDGDTKSKWGWIRWPGSAWSRSRSWGERGGTWSAVQAGHLSDHKRGRKWATIEYFDQKRRM